MCSIVERVIDNRLTAGTTSYTYNAVDNLTGELSPNGVNSTLSYDRLDRLTNLTISKGGVLASYAYTYNAAGQRLSVTEHTGRTVNYSYDALGRLVAENIGGDPNASNNGTITYSLDAVGNRLARTSTLPAIQASTSTYDANDRITSDTYDANGNTKASNGSTFNYNFENRLTSLNTAVSSISLVYDGDGNRVAKTVSGVTTGYLVDEVSPTGYPQVIEELVGGNVQRTYTFGTSLVSQQRVDFNQLTRSFYGSDAHGSVRLLTDSAGQVTDTYAYDAFGNLVSSFGSTSNEYLYSGERFDRDLSTYHLRERYYSQASGRFLSSDPFAGLIDLPWTLHKYLYVGADPVNFIDPSGLAETTEYRPKPPPRVCVVLRFAQVTASPEFQPKGNFAGRTIGEIAEALRSGALRPSQIPVRIIERGGTKLIVNTRSALALTRANIPQRLWTILDSTGDPDIEREITRRLIRNGLTDKGTDVLRITGAGKRQSCLR